MASLALAARLVLAATLAFAAVHKIIDQRTVRAQLRAFDVPEALNLPIAVLLPVAEVVVASLLVTVRPVAWPAWIAAGLLGGFTVFLVANLVNGRRVPCPCFGARSDAISSRTIVRNGGLLALAVLGAARATGVDALAVAAWTAGLAAFVVAGLRWSR